MRDGQYVVIAPTPHCRFQTEDKETIVGERNMGDVRFDYDELTFQLVRLLAEGRRERSSRKTHPGFSTTPWGSISGSPPRPGRPPKREVVTWYLDSDGANSLFGNGRLGTSPPTSDHSGSVPVRPDGAGVFTRRRCLLHGGGHGARLLRSTGRSEARHDVLVYTSEPLEEAVEITGTIG